MTHTTTTSFPLYSAAHLSTRRRELIGKGKSYNDGSTDRQKALAVAAAKERSREAFLAWFDGIATEGHSQALSFRSERLTGQEIAIPPLDTEQNHYDLLKDLSPRDATRPSFWTSYQLEMVRRGLIDPADLATPIASTKSTGRARLQKAIQGTDKKKLDGCTRTIFRQLGGLPEVRGYISVFVDCRLSRAWWRGHISHQVAEDMELDVEDVWTHLRMSDATWVQIQQYTVRRLTVVGDRNVRSAVVARLMEAGLEGNRKNRRQRIQAFLAQVGARCAYQALGALSAKENFAIFSKMPI